MDSVCRLRDRDLKLTFGNLNEQSIVMMSVDNGTRAHGSTERGKQYRHNEIIRHQTNLLPSDLTAWTAKRKLLFDISTTRFTPRLTLNYEL
jgi:hypothetical protein